jgi:hypothetical protein
VQHRSRQLCFGGCDAGLSEVQRVLGGFSAPFSQAKFFMCGSAKSLSANFGLARVMVQVTDNFSGLID